MVKPLCDRYAQQVVHLTLTAVKTIIIINDYATFHVRIKIYPLLINFNYYK